MQDAGIQRLLGETVNPGKMFTDVQSCRADGQEKEACAVKQRRREPKETREYSQAGLDVANALEWL